MSGETEWQPCCTSEHWRRDAKPATADFKLCYLDAANVNSPAGVLSELDVVTASGEQLGSIAGVVIEAAAGRARYLDIRSSGGYAAAIILWKPISWLRSIRTEGASSAERE